jgi:hypothetical protein
MIKSELLHWRRPKDIEKSRDRHKEREERAARGRKRERERKTEIQKERFFLTVLISFQSFTARSAISQISSSAISATRERINTAGRSRTG